MTDYRVFGLRVRSDIDLRELQPVAQAGDPDVTIRLAAVDADCSAPGIHAIDGDLLFVAEDVARYRISGGKSIRVEPAKDVPAQNVRLFLLGSAFGALLHQRGLLPLHANAVEIAGKAVAFMGESGSGKSTLAAWFHDQGHAVLADDVCVIGFGRDGAPEARPGLPRVRLWKEALEASGRDANDYSRSFVGDEDFDKYDVPLALTPSQADTLPLAALYVLERGPDLRLQPLTGIDAAEAVFAHTYRGAFVSSAANTKSHWQQCLQVVRRVPIFRCERQWDARLLAEQSAAILSHLLSL